MTNGDPAAKVTHLQADKTGPLCPNEAVNFEATTSPPSATVTWKVAVDGGEPKTVEGIGNTLIISGAGGETMVVTASLTNSLSETVTWKVADLEINVPPGPNNGRYVITDEPRMPVITATALFQGGSGTLSDWDVSVVFDAVEDCPPFGPNDLRTVFSVSRAGGNEITTDFFGDVVRGGGIIFSTTGTVNGCTISAEAGAGLVGTNPQQTDIQAALPNRTLQRIACRESGQRQFDAPPNGGTGNCPLFGPGGKVGIMQIDKPTDDEVWNWQKNVDKGMEIFNARVATASAYPSEVAKSDKFKSLVADFNKKRQEQGLKSIMIVPPDFGGDFDENIQELAMDAIRGYDGWNGQDGFGLELHEYRVAVDGQGALVVTDVNEETLQGKSVWERVPAADRPPDQGRPNYVDEVLAFSFDCTTATVPCHLTGIIANDTTFVRLPTTFIADGTGLATVRWRAKGGRPATGTGANFTTKWASTGSQTVTATCGGITKTVPVAVLDVSIDVTDSPGLTDDVVQVKSDHPPRRFRVPCSIKLSGPATKPVTIRLTNPDGRLRFPDPADPDKFDVLRDVELPANGNPAAFEISGEQASAKKGDSKIHASHLVTGFVVEKNVTVFSFDLAQILLKIGGNYKKIAGGSPDSFVFTTLPSAAVNFSAKARLRPGGLDCTALQIFPLRVGIMQEISDFLATATWATPTIAWKPNARSGDTIEVESLTRVEKIFASTVVPPVNDGVDDNTPLFDAKAVQPPIGCAGAKPAESSCFFGEDTSPPSRDFPNATVTWTGIAEMTIKAQFRTFCVIWNIDTREFCALREAKWELDVRDADAHAHAIIHADAPASADPAMPPPTLISAPVTPTQVAGPGRIKFTWPATVGQTALAR
jgi:hypothetical protein